VLMNQRLLELALKGLETEREKIDEEIAQLQNQLHVGTSVLTARQPTSATTVKTGSPPRRGPMSAAQRKAVSETMKQRWAERNGHRKPGRGADGRQRQQVLLAAVRKLRQASIGDVAKATGFDQRGIAGSFHHLVKSGQLKETRAGKYMLGS
jgi:hypothetical protein